MVGDLVGVEPQRLEHGLRGLVEVGGEVRVGGREPAAPHRTVERRPRLDGQLVRRQVLGTQRRRLVQRPRPRRGGLAGEGVDQVERDPREGRDRGPDGAARGRGVVVAAEEGQARVVQRLHAQRQPADPGGGEGGEASGLRVGGVRLQRHLQVRRGGPQARGQGDELGRGPGRHQRGRAAAEVDGLQRAGAGQRGLATQVVADGADERRLLLPPPAVAHDVEVAVGADARAVGPVDVDPQRRGRRAHSSAAFSLAKALARWLIACLAAGSISPKVRSRPSGRKIGS